MQKRHEQNIGNCFAKFFLQPIALSFQFLFLNSKAFLQITPVFNFFEISLFFLAPLQTRRKATAIHNFPSATL